MPDNKTTEPVKKKRSERLNERVSHIIDEPLDRKNLFLLLKLVAIFIVLVAVRDYERALAMILSIVGGF